MNSLKIAEAVEKHKLPVVCATCNKYWKARDMKLPEPQCLSQNNCASPIGGGTFHEYEGPIPDFRIWCFVCGAKPDVFMFINKDIISFSATFPHQLFGICNFHLEEAKTLIPIGIEDPSILKRYYMKEGKISSLDAIKKDYFHKQTLEEAMSEVDKHIKSKKFEA